MLPTRSSNWQPDSFCGVATSNAHASIRFQLEMTSLDESTPCSDAMSRGTLSLKKFANRSDRAPYTFVVDIHMCDEPQPIVTGN